jgi:hypothetical protein
MIKVEELSNRRSGFLTFKDAQGLSGVGGMYPRLTIVRKHGFPRFNLPYLSNQFA